MNKAKASSFMLFTAERKSVMKYMRMLCLLFSLLLISCSSTTANEPSATPVIAAPAKTPALPPASEHPSTGIVIGKHANYPELDIVSDIDWQEHYHHAVHYPLLSRPDIDQSIRALLDERIDVYKTELIEAHSKIGEEVIPELLIEYEIKFLSEKYIAVLFTENKFFGGSNQEVNLFSVNISLEQNKLLQLEDIFKADSNYLHDLSHYCRQKIIQTGQLDDYYDPQRLEEEMAPEPDNFKTFILTDHELIFYFDWYQLAARTAGIHTISVPYVEWNDKWEANYVPYEPTPPAAVQKPSIKPGGTEPSEGEAETAVPPSASPVVAAEAKRKIALTFDDGPHKKVTPVILDILKKKGGKATFFVLGNRVQYYPEIMQRMVDEGHEIGNHSWNHSELTKLTEKEIEEQLLKTQQAVYDTVGIWPGTVRPPYGAYDDIVIAAAQLPIMMWSVDTLDWKHRNKNKVIKAALAGAKDGGVILFHDLYSSTADALGPIMDKLTAQGYEFVTVSELFNQHPEDLSFEAGRVYRNVPAAQ